VRGDGRFLFRVPLFSATFVLSKLRLLVFANLRETGRIFLSYSLISSPRNAVPHTIVRSIIPYLIRTRVFDRVCKIRFHFIKLLFGITNTRTKKQLNARPFN